MLMAWPLPPAVVGADSSADQREQQRGKTSPGSTNITNSAGDAGVPSKYTVLPVARGKKVEVESSLVGDKVVGQKGEELGQLKSVIMDSETKRIEYAMIEIGHSGQYQAFPWSNFKVDKEKGQVQLNIPKEQLNPSVAAADTSPDVKKVFEDELKNIRERESKIEHRGLGVTDEPAAGGSQGEDKAGGAGPSGPRAMPKGEAPQFEGGK